MDTYALAVQQLKKAIENAIEKAISNGELPQAEAAPFIIETPADRSHGDFATNAAMAGAKAFRMPPFKIAQAITSNLDLEGTMFDRFETAGPGFINFFLGTEFYSAVIREILANPEAYGRSEYGRDEKVMVEFVSANPTGPMHMGNARGGALGDCLAAVLDKAGYNTWREFYVNDAGNQIEKFGCSLEARYLQIFKGDEIEFPEDGYQGEDIKDLAKEYADLNGDSLVNVSAEERKKALVDYALPKNIKKMQADMEKYKIFYDKWFFESELHKSGAVKAVVDLLTEKGFDISSVHQDCGMLIYDPQTQDTHSGGSGCGCAASVLAGYILPGIIQKKWKRILFVPTGALLSKVSFNEGDPIPGIAHAVVIEQYRVPDMM